MKLPNPFPLRRWIFFCFANIEIGNKKTINIGVKTYLPEINV